MIVPVPITFPLRRIALDLVCQLDDLVLKTSPSVKNAWEAFQIELGLEKLFHGRPYSFANKADSLRLGPGCDIVSTSRTDHLEFLAFEDWNIMQGHQYDLPQLGKWTSSDLLVKISAFFMIETNGRTIYLLLLNIFIRNLH